MAFQKLGALIERPASTVSSGGNLALANNSAGFQRITGTSAHTVTLPQANAASPNECPNGLKFVINNRSSDVVTVNYFGGALAATLAAGTQRTFRLSDNSTSAGDWDITNESGGGSGEALSEDEKLGVLAALASSLYKDAEADGVTLKVNPEEIGGNFWSTKAPLLRNNRWAGATTLNGFIYAIGGDNGSFFNFNDRYSDDSNYFLGRQTMITPRRAHSVFTLSGKNYAALGSTTGGSRTNLAEAYTDSTNTWAAVTALTTPLQNMTNGLVVDDYGYTVGGEVNGATITDAVNMYNAVANAWYPRSVIPASRMDLQGASVGGNLYVFAGLNSAFAYTNTNYSFTPLTNSWSTKTALPVTRTGGCAFASFDRIMAVAGYDGAAQSYVYEYTTSLNLWKFSSNIQTARYDISNSGGNLNGIGYAWGGSSAGGPVIASVESYMPVSFFQVPLSKRASAVPTSIFAAAALNGVATSVPVRLKTDGEMWKYFEANKDGVLKLSESLGIKFSPTHPIMAAGGDGTATSETWSHTTNTWQQRQSMISARGGGFQFPVDGYGHVGGGSVGGNILSERFDDIANTWVARTSLTQARQRTMGHALNGFGYCYSTSGSFSNNQQKYNSALNSWTIPASTYTPANGYAHGYALSGFGYIIGGDSGSGTLTNNQQYNDTTDSFTAKAAVHTVQQGGSATFEGLGYIIGGYNGGSDITTNSSYNPGTNAWTSKASLASATRANRCDVIDGLIHSMGGNNSPTSHFRYNPYANAWSGSLTAMSASREFIHAPMGGFYRNYQLQVGLPTYLAAIGAGQWVAKANMNLAKAPLSYFTIGEISYQSYGNIAAGSGRTNDLQGYYTTINTWITETPGALSAADTGGQCATNTLGARGFINGHNDAGSLDGGTIAYDNVLKAWTVLATGGGSGQGNSNFVINGFAYSAGGGPGVPAHTTSTYRYNPATNSWSSNIATTSIAHYGGVGGVYDGFVFLAGSSTGSSNVNERFNDAANVWNTKTSLPTHTEATGSVVIGNGWHIVAGYNGGPSNSHQVYKAETDSWSNSTVYPISAYQVGGGKVGNDGYFAGGYTGSYTTASYQWASAIQNIVLGAALRVGE